MTKDELLRRITTFPLIAGALAHDMLSGDFRSIFRGEGIEFDEVRRYEQGDDVRSIDRNVSIRYGTPYVKLYREEREITVFVILDCSASMFAGSETRTVRRIDQAVLAAALIAFSAEHSSQRFGALFFDKEIRMIFKPRRGRSHIMAFAKAALDARPHARGTQLEAAISGTARLLKRRSIVVIISDFLSLGWEDELGHLSEKHDCIACRIGDSFETEFPNLGLFAIEDPETAANITANTASQDFRSAWAEWQAERVVHCESVFRRYHASYLSISTDSDVVRIIKGFFRGRRG